MSSCQYVLGFSEIIEGVVFDTSPPAVDSSISHVVVSDFFCDLEPLLNCFQHLRFQKHDLAVFQLLDRAELEFQFDRPVRFVDLESSMSVVTEPSMIRDEYLRQLRMFLESLRRGCNEFGVDYRQVVIDQDYERVLADFLVERVNLAASAR